jgi:hypothetical protein
VTCYAMLSPDMLCCARAVLCCGPGVVLAAASPYFETLLRGWACSHQTLHMVVGDDQLTAAQQLLSFMYTGEGGGGLMGGGVQEGYGQGGAGGKVLFTTGRARCT